MEEMIDYAFVLNQLALAQLKVIKSQGDGSDDFLLSLIKCYLKDLPEDLLGYTYDEHKLLIDHTLRSPPIVPGMYLKLFHGRNTIDEHLFDWGRDGPWIGPLHWFYSSYLTNISLKFTTGEELSSQDKKLELPSAIYLYQGFLYYDGIYYADWELEVIE